MEEKMTYIRTKEQMELLAERLLKTGGLREEDAKQIAVDLVKADMRGLYSHGVSRIPMYLKRIECNCVKSQPDIQVEQVGMAALKVNGYACMVYTNSSAALPVFGGKSVFLGAAPFAAGIPGGYHSPRQDPCCHDQ